MFFIPDFLQFGIIYLSLHCIFNKGSVVQLYRTSDSGSEGLGLESQRGHNKKSILNKLKKTVSSIASGFFYQIPLPLSLRRGVR